ncbi:hypothetical protein BRADI_1g04290v3 [Brachypodium distachyon]|uniref:Uncharacterized protein n=1 Tax=Brachypodium distachyon TaxID=15368 RepID=A0A2K2DI33_BRADI|nr:hypothetical protein BRADI_1g04290v3 [Brachypodium distachyon]
MAPSRNRRPGIHRDSHAGQRPACRRLASHGAGRRPDCTRSAARDTSPETPGRPGWPPATKPHHRRPAAEAARPLRRSSLNPRGPNSGHHRIPAPAAAPGKHARQRQIPPSPPPSGAHVAEDAAIKPPGASVPTSALPSARGRLRRKETPTALRGVGPAATATEEAGGSGGEMEVRRGPSGGG